LTFGDLEKCLPWHFLVAKRNAISALLTFSITYRDRKGWGYLVVPHDEIGEARKLDDFEHFNLLILPASPEWLLPTHERVTGNRLRTFTLTAYFHDKIRHSGEKTL